MTGDEPGSIEARAREIDPMAWISHAFSTSDDELRAALARRRQASLAMARKTASGQP